MLPFPPKKLIYHILYPLALEAVSLAFRSMLVIVERYEGGSICNENPSITPSTNELGFNAISQTKDKSVVVLMVHETLFYLSKFNKLQTFEKTH